MLEVNEKEEGIVTIHLSIGPLKQIRYRDANPVPTSPLANDVATAPSGPVNLGYIM